MDSTNLMIEVPLRFEASGAIRVGKTRVLLELIIKAYNRGASASEILRMYDSQLRNLPDESLT